MVQIIPGLHRIRSMCQVREHPDSTTSKVFTVLKWWMIMMLNRKLLEKQRVLNCFASDEVHIGHFFHNINATVSFGNRLNLSIFKIFCRTDKLTNWQMDKTNCLTPSHMRARGNNLPVTYRLASSHVCSKPYMSELSWYWQSSICFIAHCSWLAYIGTILLEILSWAKPPLQFFDEFSM